MRFTEFKAEDLAPAAELFTAIFNGPPWNDEWTVNTAEKRLRDLMKTPNFLGVCCYEQDELLGFALGNREQWYQGEVFHLKEMGVKRGSQGQGLGTKLMEKLKEKLKQTEVEGMYLVTAKGTRAEKFYRKNGLQINEGLVVMNGEVNTEEKY